MYRYNGIVADIRKVFGEVYLPQSPSLSPEAQKKIVQDQIPKVSEVDDGKYEFYVQNGVVDAMVEPPSEGFKLKLLRRVPEQLRMGLWLRKLSDCLFKEVVALYYCSVKTAIGEFRDCDLIRLDIKEQYPFLSMF